jgi:glucose-1-phosphate thymidylyltransferase
MKGVVIAGGEGTRLRPVTHIYNKSFAPVYNSPLIYYPLFSLKRAGIGDVVLVSAPEFIESYKHLLKDGSEFGMNINYATQAEPKGISHALKQAEPHAKGHSVISILGDNIFEEDLTPAIEEFKKQKFDQGDDPVRGAKIVLTQVDNPHRYGVAKFDGDKIDSLYEKPDDPPSNWAITGMFMYDERVFDFIDTLEPSDRGELESTDLHNVYVREGTLTYEKLKGKWFDAGTFDSLLAASNFVANHPVLGKKDLLTDSDSPC